MTLFHLLALQCCVAVVLSAPLQHPGSSLAEQGFREAAGRSKTLVEKILQDIPALHAHTIHTPGLTLQPSSQTPLLLQRMVSSLGIHPPPALMPLSDSFTLENSLSRMLVGIKQHQNLLGGLATQLVGLDDLRADLRDLVTQITKMQELGGRSSTEQSPPTTPTLGVALRDEYEVQVAGHLTLRQLQAFCQDVTRSLRNISTHRRGAAL